MFGSATHTRTPAEARADGLLAFVARLMPADPAAYRSCAAGGSRSRTFTLSSVDVAAARMVWNAPRYWLS